MTEGPAAPAGARWQNATITAIAPRTQRIRSVLLRPEVPFAHLAGQHVDVRLTAADGYSAMRSYSIASAPGTSGLIEVAIERLDDGEVSPYFHEVAEVGDTIELRGPLGGHFVWRPGDGGPLLLIGGGSGVVPLMAMIRHRHETGAETPALLVLSAPTWEGVLYRDELLDLERARDGFALVLALTREPARRQGDYSRRIDEAVVAEAAARLPGPPKHVFVCGSNAFVNAATDGALAAGIAASRIRTERYGG